MTALVQGTAPREHLHALCIHIRVLGRSGPHISMTARKILQVILLGPGFQNEAIGTTHSVKPLNQASTSHKPASCELGVDEHLDNDLVSGPHGELLHGCHYVNEDVPSHGDARGTLLAGSRPYHDYEHSKAELTRSLLTCKAHDMQSKLRLML